MAAAAAADGRSKTENVASPSPRVLISRPPREVTTCSTSSSWRASATPIASASASQAAVEPSMSVSRKVTARVTAERCCATGTSSAGILRDDRGLEPPKLGSGVDPQLVRQQRPCPLISAKGFTLPAGAIEGEHQLPPTPFAQRRSATAASRSPMTSAARPVASSASARSSTSAAWPSIHRVFSDIPRRPSGSSGFRARDKRLLEARHRLAGVASGGGIASPSGGRFVTRGINLALGQGPTRSLRQNEAVAQGATQRGDVGLQGFGGGARRILAPEQFDECVGRHNRAAVQPEHREDGARFGARDQRRASRLAGPEEVPKPPAPRLEA